MLHREVCMKEFNCGLSRPSLKYVRKHRIHRKYCWKREPDVVCYGDVHNAFHQNIKGKTLCNVGSVGNPLDLTQASYAILEGEYNQPEKGVFSIQLVRVPYDIELSIQIAREAEMPELEEYIQELTTAKYRGLK